jgi:uncharacterized protein
MPATLSFPGVYIEEIPSGVRTITGVATSITAFVGRAWKGPIDEPVRVNSYADYVRIFGGLWGASMMSYAVRQFFDNGGSQALVVRVVTRSGAGAAKAATFSLTGGMKLVAASVGTWGMNLLIDVEDKTKTKDPTDNKLFNLKIVDNDDPNKAAFTDSDKRGGTGARETFLNVSADPNSPRFVETILEQQSNLVRLSSNAGGNAPSAQQDTAADANSGKDGVSTTTAAAAAAEVDGNSNAKTGMFALQKADLFNLLCVPPLTTAPNANSVPTNEADVPMTTWVKAVALCKERRALALVDAPIAWTPANVTTATVNISSFSQVERTNAALYFPRLRVADPLQENNLADFAPCGAVAGVMSRTDTERGVWKAPAGIDASLRGVAGLSISGVTAGLNDGDNGALNPLGINCIRAFPVIGTVVWGARTLEGSDILASEWKHVPVRRTALFIEESLYRGTQWVVFEPNDEPLWAQIRLNVGAFMQNLFRQGAFQGQTPRDAYFVKCDKETTTQNDVDLGIVNIIVGFAPLKPAEFVVIKLQQMAGQIQT